VGLKISGGGSVVQGLAFFRFTTAAIMLETAGNNTIRGNFIGTNADASAVSGGLGDGILIDNSADNLIGGTTPAARNIISGAGLNGVHIINAGSTGNRIQGNFIGIDMTGKDPLPNGVSGVRVEMDASRTTIGGTAPGPKMSSLATGALE
jgi:hypothetical protein